MNAAVGMVMCTKQMWFWQIAYRKGICNEWWGWSNQNKFTLKYNGIYATRKESL
jgi:hypothetical protein